MKKFKILLKLFLTMFKVGLFTFGGGYAMIAVIEREVVEKKCWLEKNAYLDVIAIAESTPGPLAINTATYIGYKIGGVLGSIFATIGVILPSFIIIFCISLFFEAFIKLKYVNYAFRGIQVAVAFIILSAGVKMFKNIEKNIFNIILTVITVCSMFTLGILSISFSSIFYILIGGIIGLIAYAIMLYNKKRKKRDLNNKSEDKGEDK